MTVTLRDAENRIVVQLTDAEYATVRAATASTVRKGFEDITRNFLFSLQHQAAETDKLTIRESMDLLTSDERRAVRQDIEAIIQDRQKG